MSERTFAAWVAPFAAKLRADDEAVLAFARSLPEDAWSTPTENEGWTVKDLMAHIGKGNDQLFQGLLRQVIAGEKVDTEIFRTVDTDGENMAGVEARKNMSPAELIAEYEDSGEELLGLLSQLTDEHEHLTQDDPPFHFKGFLGAVDKESHSLEHLKQMKAAVGVRA
jgi:uncharacterized protein (TIGR03083 family)